jgi:hypothetical protein
MKRSFLLSVSVLSVLAVAACAPQEASPPTSANAAVPSTSTYYDGTYTGSFVQIGAGPSASACQNFKVAPALTIRNGAARFAALDLEFQGYVTAQGELKMESAGGQTFEGQIDPYFVLRGRVTGNCIYDASWTRQAKS